MDMSATQTFLDRAVQHLTIQNSIRLQIHLDPNNITWHEIGHRLVEITLANINIPNLCALVGAGFYAATFLMRTMVPLRVFGIISAFFFMAYGALGGAVATFLMYFLLLPINIIRLFQIQKLVKKARVAVEGELSADWLKPFMNGASTARGMCCFGKGNRPMKCFLSPRECFW